MLKWLRNLFDENIRRASCAAQQFVEVENPDWRVDGASLRADETERWVFAVFYHTQLRARPTPYLLVWVRKQALAVGEIDGSEADVYALRGYK